MGFLTTITIRNDDLGQIEKHPDEFMKNLLQAINENEGGEIPCGYSCNAAIVQKSKHADDWAVYLHAGNTVTHMSSFSEESVKFARVNPKFYKEMVDYLYDQSKSLKAWFKRVFNIF